MRVLDLFCGAGGAAMGLRRAWSDAEIVGVDIKPQPRYPFTFIQADAMTYPLDGFDFIWASPPCQGYSTLTRLGGRQHERLVNDCLWRLHYSGAHFALENVTQALRDMSPYLVWYSQLCGVMFGLNVARHRLIATNFPFMVPRHLRHPDGLVTVLTKSCRSIGRLRGPSSHEAGKRAMGIDWMTQKELGEAVPPAYSEFIARQLLVDRSSGLMA